MTAWKRMASGKYIDLEKLERRDLNLLDIEVALNHILRFTGHFKDASPLTVAQHTLLCYELALRADPENRRLHLAVLVHDFAEAYIGDVATPVKRAMGDRWTSFAKPIEELVEERFFGELVDEELHDLVKMYDLAALDIERRTMWSSQYGLDKWPENPLECGSLKEKQELFWQVKNCGYINLADLYLDLTEGADV